MKRLIICSLLLCTSAICFSQTVAASTRFSRIEVGGNFGLAFGSNSTSVVIAPQLGYVINKHFTVGGGINYSHFSSSKNDISQNFLGLNVFGRVRPIQNIILQAQPEIFRVWTNWDGVSTSELVPTFLIGAGMIIPMGGRGGMSMMLHYDVVQNRYSPYRAGVFYSVGYTVLL